MRLHAAHQRVQLVHQLVHVVVYLVVHVVIYAALSATAFAQPSSTDETGGESVEDATGDAEDRAARAAVEARLRARLTSGGLDRSTLASVYLRLALLEWQGQAEGDADAEAFDRAFALDPTVRFPEGLDAELLDALRRRAAATEALRIVIETSSDTGEPTVRIDAAPEGLVRTLEVTGRNGFSRTLGWEGAPRVIAAPIDALPLRVRALDAHGNEVGVVGPPPLAAVEVPPPPVDPDADGEEPEERPPQPDLGTTLLESPLFWVLVGLVVAGVAVGVGFTASGDRYLLDAPVVR